mgnify:CR=1 FL=1
MFSDRCYVSVPLPMIMQLHHPTLPTDVPSTDLSCTLHGSPHVNLTTSSHYTQHTHKYRNSLQYQITGYVVPNHTPRTQLMA